MQALRRNIEGVLHGKPEVVDLALTCWLAEGHLLVEDVPGTGKTTLARAMAASVDASWHRIQFTPDLLPSDVTGVSVYRQDKQVFEFHPGPVFAHVVLADEINRASPKTQSALLEVMEERRVTVDGRPYDAPRPFIVVATQNPVEMDGTYRLPEAQLDRFLLRASVGYLDAAAEVEVLKGHARGVSVDRLAPVASVADLEALIATAAEVTVTDELYGYCVRLCAATREHPDLRLGVSTRGTLALVRAARARAVVQGRGFATADDVQALAVAVLAHRLLLAPQAELRGTADADIVRGLLDSVPTPDTGRVRT